MPIIELQRRMRQLGEIRIGRVVDTGKVSQKTGKPILRPEKLNRFRLTSASRPLLEDVAALYGGAVQAWTPANGGPAEWEVFTDADRLPVLVPPREPVTQWYEMYKGSKCVRRCDGETEQKSDQPCMCDPDRRACQITTRLNVMLRDVPGLGVWLLTSHGYYAATELPEVAHFLAGTHGYVDAWLAMEEKRIVREDGNVAQFMVPKLDVAVTPAQLLAGEGAVAELGAAERPAVEQPQRQQIEAAPAGPSAENFLTRARAVSTFAEFKVIWDEAAASRISPTQAQSDEMTAIGKRLKAAGQALAAAPAPADEAQAAPAPGADRDLVWQQIVAAWPRGMAELHTAIHGAMGVQSQAATAGELAAFLKLVQAGKFNEPVQVATGAEAEVPF
ncbi:hypothetical protein ACIBKY_17465 [Nonomuraea sp. NPDC050394]|uniref:recombination directionality factor n=1 Tax=Nonomuraea sp. NPDC050394 TaxID=3364363 RepID=UPI0037ABC94F